jgi:hypothetical protein
VSSEIQEQLNRLTSEQLDDLAEAVLDFRDPGEVTAWIAARA